MSTLKNNPAAIRCVTEAIEASRRAAEHAPNKRTRKAWEQRIKVLEKELAELR